MCNIHTVMGRCGMEKLLNEGHALFTDTCSLLAFEPRRVAVEC